MPEPTPVSQSGPETVYQPYVPAEKSIAEVTLKAVLLGAILSVVFGVANAYLALKYGLTVSASIPAAVMSMAILRTLFKKVTVLENNIVQTVGSAGESLAAGVAFTIPVFFIWAAKPHLMQGLADLGYHGGISAMDIFLLSMLGGILGIVLMIPLRKYLVQKEHGTLPFPEGTACAEIIIAGEEGGAKAKNVFLGLGIGAGYKLLMTGFRLWPESLEKHLTKYLKGGILSIEATPALFGVGYILGPRIASYMTSGAVLGYLAIGPLLSFIGSFLPDGVAIPPATPQDTPLGMMTADELRAFYIRYLGIGGVSVGGFIALLRAAPTIGHSFGEGFKQIFAKKDSAKQDATPRTDRDLSMKWVMLSAAFVIAVIFFMPEIDASLVAIASAVIFGFLFIVVAARIVGEIGSTNSPVSGMTIATLLVTSFILISTGASGIVGMVATMGVGTVVCIAVCLSGDIAQDLKTGYLLGATPVKQQLTEFIGLLAPAMAMGVTIYILNDAFGFVADATHPNPLQAPQANAMATIVEAAFGSGLPWPPIIAGGVMALGIELLGIRSLPVAIGMYLPLSLSTPILAGGLLNFFIHRAKSKKLELPKIHQRGVLFGSGLVAGDALVGVIIAALVAGVESYRGFYESHASMETSLLGHAGPWMSLLLFAGLGVFGYRYFRNSRDS